MGVDRTKRVSASHILGRASRHGPRSWTIGRGTDCPREGLWNVSAFSDLEFYLRSLTCTQVFNLINAHHFPFMKQMKDALIV